MQEVQFLTEKEVAELTRYSLSKLQRDRYFSKGLPYVKDGRNVRYIYGDIIKHMQERKIENRN